MNFKREEIYLSNGGLRLVLTLTSGNRSYEIASAFRGYAPPLVKREAIWKEMEDDMGRFVVQKQVDNNQAQFSLFGGDEPDIKGMVPTGAHGTEKDAALSIARLCKTKLQRQVAEAFQEAGEKGLTDEELEELPQFAYYGPTTVSKRRTELYQMGLLVESGRTRPNHRGFQMIVWRWKWAS